MAKEGPSQGGGKMPHASVPGKRNCMKCGREFLSPDQERIRRCERCKRSEDGSATRVAKMSDVRNAIRRYFNDST